MKLISVNPTDISPHVTLFLSHTLVSQFPTLSFLKDILLLTSLTPYSPDIPPLL